MWVLSVMPRSCSGVRRFDGNSHDGGLQANPERRSLAGPALCLDRPSQPITDPVHEIQSQPEPAALTAPITTLEDSAQVLRRNSESRIADRQRIGPEDGLDRALLSEVDRIEKQVVDHARDHYW